MAPPPEQDDLDQFWRDLSAEMISDTITLEEAERRMAAAEDDELSEAQIQDIVQRATTRRSSLKPAVDSLPRAPRGRIYSFGGWRLTANVAATGAFSALLLSATMIVMLWPETKNYNAFRYDHATMIVVDTNETFKRRRLAIARVHGQVRYAIKLLKEITAGGGELSSVAEKILLEILLALRSPTDLRLYHGTVAKLTELGDGARSVNGPTSIRVGFLRALGREAVSGISCLANCSEGDPMLRTLAATSFSKMRDLLRR